MSASLQGGGIASRKTRLLLPVQMLEPGHAGALAGQCECGAGYRGHLWYKKTSDAACHSWLRVVSYR